MIDLQEWEKLSKKINKVVEDLDGISYEGCGVFEFDYEERHYAADENGEDFITTRLIANAIAELKIALINNFSFEFIIALTSMVAIEEKHLIVINFEFTLRKSKIKEFNL